MDFFNWNFWMIGRYSPMRTGLGKIPSLGQFHLFNHGRYEKNRCENCARRGFLAQLLHIMCYAF